MAVYPAINQGKNLSRFWNKQHQHSKYLTANFSQLNDVLYPVYTAPNIRIFFYASDKGAAYLDFGVNKIPNLLFILWISEYGYL